MPIIFNGNILCVSAFPDKFMTETNCVMVKTLHRRSNMLAESATNSTCSNVCEGFTGLL